MNLAYNPPPPANMYWLFSFDRRPENELLADSSSMSLVNFNQKIAWNIPLQIIGPNRFHLDCVKNRVFWNPQPSAHQWWILEHDETGTSVYIRSAITNQYIGCPNRNQRMYLYTSKTRFTTWKLTIHGSSIVSLTYIGIATFG